MLIASTARAVQAPGAAGLWDVAGTTLTQSPALETGPTGTFWNPTAILGGEGLRLGVQTVQTPDVLGMTALLAGISRRIGRHLGVGMVFGRVQVGDLVRTTTSPLSEEGDIPVYEQLAGLAFGAEFRGVRTAAVLRAHDARFDMVRTSGLTFDVGASAQPHTRLRIAATSQFVAADFSNRRTERYYAGAEYRALRFPAWGTPATLSLRYGVTLRDRRELEHNMGLGLGLGFGVTVDSAFQYERAFGDNAWRFVLGVGIRAGRYSVIAARGGGIEGIGANYRIGLDVDL
jgi:hypothetical protein